GDGNYSIKWKDGLPAGLSLNSNLEIVGKPTVAIEKMLKMYVCDGTGAKTGVWLKLRIIDEQASVEDKLVGKSVASVEYLNGAFVIASTLDNVNCSIYSINGTMVDDFMLCDGETRIFGFDYPKGVYAMYVNGERFKIVKY
ncbi:MAG: hypothetical protein J6X12_10920, partial [Paludibacteraceae bacterium]|nr:hypothetical protein [Paludibacteraceae bacterium]